MLKLNLKPSALKLISLILTVTGIIFIMASQYIGSIAIRIAMIVLILFSIINIKTTYNISLKEKITYLLAIAAALIGFYKPEFTMLIFGIFLLYITLPIYFKSIKNKDYSDFISLIISGTGILFAVLCILNSKAALKTVIIIIGIAFTILGCLSLFQILTKKDTSDNNTEHNQFNFEDTNNL